MCHYNEDKNQRSKLGDRSKKSTQY